MSWKKLIIIVVLAAIAGGVLYAWKEFNRTNKDLTQTDADFEVTASDLITQFETSETSAGKKYTGKILAVTGIVKKLESDELGYLTISLGDNDKPSSVRCSMDSVYAKDASGLSARTSVNIRGVCTGFNKDELGLGSDVILNRCVLIK